MFGIKKGMISSYDSRGRRVGATVVEIKPNHITQIKNSNTKDGYTAVQLGVGLRAKVKKPQAGHFKKAGLEAKINFLREIRVTDPTKVEGLELGQEISVGSLFKKGDAVKVSGVSKGRGFQGGVKRYNFKGGPKTHGQSDRHRAPGSIGAGTTPGRVYKGKRMAGHMGVTQVSYKGLEVVGIDRKENLLMIKGGVPGPIGGLVTVVNIGQIKGYTAPPEEKEDESEAESTEKAAAANDQEAEAKPEQESTEIVEKPAEEAVTEEANG